MFEKIGVSNSGLTQKTIKRSYLGWGLNPELRTSRPPFGHLWSRSNLSLFWKVWKFNSFFVHRENFFTRLECLWAINFVEFLSWFDLVIQTSSFSIFQKLGSNFSLGCNKWWFAIMMYDVMPIEKRSSILLSTDLSKSQKV